MKLRVVLVWLAAGLAANPALAAECKGKPIRMVVPFTAGSASDLLARMIDPYITQAPARALIYAAVAARARFLARRGFA